MQVGGEGGKDWCGGEETVKVLKHSFLPIFSQNKNKPRCHWEVDTVGSPVMHLPVRKSEAEEE